MGIFEKVLASDETVFRDELSLSYDYLPKMIPFRENQQKAIANYIKPLFNGMNGRNAIISGLPGIGKTAATRHVLKDLEEETQDIIPIYINCWQKQTSYKIFLDICEQLEYKFTHNKRTEELFTVVQTLLNKKAAVFVFDEIDKAEEFNFLYTILENIYRKSIICITNYKSWVSSLDERIMSRLVPEHLDFNPYTKSETEGVITERINIAFYPNVWADAAKQAVVEKTYDQKDIRTGLYLLKESGLTAEDRSSKKIERADVEKAIAKMQDFKIKKIEKLDDEVQNVLDLIKKHAPAKIGDLFKIYQEAGGSGSYKTFQRKVEKLGNNSFISIKKQIGGTEGTTSIIYYDTSKKQLSDFTDANEL